VTLIFEDIAKRIAEDPNISLADKNWMKEVEPAKDEGDQTKKKDKKAIKGA